MKKNYKFLFRAPRILAIVFILFISMFALDIFGQGYTFRKTVIGLFMHLIPSFILIITLILSRRKYPLVGAIVFTLFGLAYTTINIVQFFVSISNGEANRYYLLIRPLIIAVPALVVGILFFVNRLKKNVI